MKLSDIIQEGKISQEGIKIIEKLITDNEYLLIENSKLKDSFGVINEWFHGTTFYTKEECEVKVSDNEKSEAYNNGANKVHNKFRLMSVREFRKWKKLN